MNTVTVADALQTWISIAPTQCLDLVAPHTRPGDTAAEHAATHAIALANAGQVFRLPDVVMTYDEVLAFTTRVNDTEGGEASGDRVPFYPLAMYYPPVEGLFGAETPIPGNGHLPTLTPDTDGLYRVDVLGTVLAPALSPEVRRFADERLDVIEYSGTFPLMEIVSRHLATWGSWYDAEDAIQREITEATRDAGQDHCDPTSTGADIAHAIECIGPIDQWVCDTESFWGVSADADQGWHDLYYGDPVPADWPALDDDRAGALFYLAAAPERVFTAL